MEKTAAQPFSLSCPAQGSPVPSYRSVVKISLSEPVGGSLPKFSGEFDGFTMKKAATQPFSLACPAQGSPVPAYRSVDARFSFRTCRRFSSKIQRRAEKFHTGKGLK